MANYTADGARCCKNELNVIEIDGTNTCIKCGLVLDMLSFKDISPPSYVYANDYHLGDQFSEYCERGNINKETGLIAEDIFNRFCSHSTRLSKIPLMATSLYVACKKNGVPRSMKEISAISGCSIKQMGRYEKLVSHKYYATPASTYVERFCAKLGLKFMTTKIVLRNIETKTASSSTRNSIAIACASIYKSLPNVIRMKDLEAISGVPQSTIKRVAKTLE